RGKGRALDPLGGLVERAHLPQPVARQQLARLGERPVGHRVAATALEGTRRPRRLGCSPSPASMIPASTRRSLNAPMARSSLSSGRRSSPAGSDFTSTITFMASSRDTGPPSGPFTASDGRGGPVSTPARARHDGGPTAPDPSDALPAADQYRRGAAGGPARGGVRRADARLHPPRRRPEGRGRAGGLAAAGAAG